MTVYYNIDDITFARREILNNTLIRAIKCMTDILFIINCEQVFGYMMIKI